MNQQSPKMLTLLGKVDRRLLKKLVNPTPIEKENSGWFFVDYSPSEILLGSRFDVLLEGSEKSLVPEMTYIKLLYVLDQFANKLESIPKGFQTICQLHFASNLPNEIKKLPALTDWEYNPESITIAWHEDIKIDYPDLLLKDMYKIVSSQIPHVFISYSLKENSFTKRDFIEAIVSMFKTEKSSAEQMLNDMLLLGHVKQKNNKDLELVTQ